MTCYGDRRFRPHRSGNRSGRKASALRGTDQRGVDAQELVSPSSRHISTRRRAAIPLRFGRSRGAAVQSPRSDTAPSSGALLDQKESGREAMNVTVESEPARRACISRVDQTSPGFAAPLAPKWHIAAPACGASLEAIIAQRGKSVRESVSVLTRSWNASFDGRLFRADFSPRWSRDDAVESGE